MPKPKSVPLDKIKNIALFLVVATIPLARLYNINSYAVALFSALYLFSPRKKILPDYNTCDILFFLYYAVLCLNLIFVEQPDIEVILIKFLPLLLIPFALLYVKYKKWVLDAFVYTIIASCVICIVATYIKSKGYIFYYHDPTEILDLQLNYLAIFVCFALAIIYNELLTANVTKLRYYLFIPFLFFCLAVFYNRTSIIVCATITIFFVFFYLKKKKNVKFLIGFIIFFGIAAVWMANRPIVQSKFKEIIEIDLNNVSDYNNGINSRILSWECSWQQIKSAGFFGSGTNNTIQLLTDCYKQKISDDSIQVIERYNAHNQFLQTTLDLGYLGLLVLLLIYGYILYRAIQKKDVLLLFYFIIMVLFGMTESYMIRQWGFVFFVFFTPYLLNKWQGPKKLQENVAHG